MQVRVKLWVHGAMPTSGILTPWTKPLENVCTITYWVCTCTCQYENKEIICTQYIQVQDFHTGMYQVCTLRNVFVKVLTSMYSWTSGRLSRSGASLAWQLYFIKIPFGVVIIDEVVWECIHAPVPKILILNIKKIIALSTRLTTQCREPCTRCLLLPALLAFAFVQESFDPEWKHCYTKSMCQESIAETENLAGDEFFLSKQILSENECQSWSGTLLEPSIFNIFVLFEGSWILVDSTQVYKNNKCRSMYAKPTGASTHCGRFPRTWLDPLISPIEKNYLRY